MKEKKLKLKKGSEEYQKYVDRIKYELETLDELTKASDVANKIQSALVIWTATWNYIYQDLIISTKTDSLILIISF